MRRRTDSIGRRGAGLASTVVALALTAVCLTLVVHAALQGRRFTSTQQQRVRAFAVCQARLETLRAGGYARLPGVGARAFPVAALPGAQGETVVAAGPVPNTKSVTVRVSWPLGDDRPAGQVALSTIMAARGLTP